MLTVSSLAQCHQLIQENSPATFATGVESSATGRSHSARIASRMERTVPTQRPAANLHRRNDEELLRRRVTTTALTRKAA